MNQLNPAKLYAKALASKKENQAFLKKLYKVDPRKLDDVVHSLHEEIFSNISCFTCANCCRTLGPRLTDADITRLSSVLKIKESKFIETYLRRDEDNDFVFKNMPCPFIQDDNHCSVYEDRPKACRDFPHTDRRRFYQLLTITLKNSFTCQGVYQLLERLKKSKF